MLLSPALKDGHNFGPTDGGSSLSVLTNGALTIPPCAIPQGAPPAASSCQHNRVNGDIIDQAVPWNTTDWRLVHSGHLPLWDAQAGTGNPQLLNFESSVLALPTLVGYLVPLSWSFLVTVLIKLLIAGLGTYWCSRVLGARAAAAALGGTSFMFSGAIAGWLGWSISGPLVWAGAILASLVLTYRSPRRAWPSFLLACSVAFAIFGGFPEDYALLAIAFFVLAVVAGGAALVFGAGLSSRGVARLVLGVAGGFGFSSILWLPGLTVVRAAVRGGVFGATGLPLHYAAVLFAPGYDGLPTAGSVFFGNTALEGSYFETASSVALVTVALGFTALFALRRRPVVLGLGAMAAATFLISFRLGGASPVQRLIIDLGGRSLILSRSLALLGFALSVLGALGAELLLARYRERTFRRTFEGAVALVGIVVIVLTVKAFRPGLPGPYAALRRDSLLWPIGTTAFLVLVAVGVHLAGREPRRGGPVAAWSLRVLPLALVGVATSAGLFAEVGINSYAHTAYPKTQATDRLVSLVGSSLVGIDGGNVTDLRQWERVGFYPNINEGYGVDELALHDPLVSRTYFTAWPVANADPGGATNLFVPDVNTVALARRYGVEYVLTFPGRKPPVGMRPIATIAGSILSTVPQSGRFTTGDGVPLRSTHPEDTTYVVDTEGRHGTLVARITNSPGWHASANGSALSIRPVGGATSRTGVFLSVEIPPGATSVRFHYTPPHLALAVALELASLIGVALAALWCRLRRRGEPSLR